MCPQPYECSFRCLSVCYACATGADLARPKFVKVDVDKHTDGVCKYDVFDMPTFLFAKADKIVETMMRANTTRLNKTEFYQLE